MQLVTSTPTLESAGLVATRNFKISTSAHAFKILSSGLYSNKIAAVLRELSCNAIDANVAAGRANVPIVVKLPTAIDIQFYVQDNGPGMSDEFVLSNYTTYFESTKSQSNDAIGGFGLGSKSPFAYTDQFTVESVHDGIHSTYVAYLDEHGAPAISRTASMTASPEWPSGVRVSLPVRNEDRNKFIAEATTLFAYYTSPVRVIGANITPLSYKQKTPTYGFIDRERHNITGSWAVMGNVPYRILFSQSHTEDTTNADLVRSMCNALERRGAVLFFNIGDLSVTPSRETLEFDKRTVDALISRFSAVMQSVTDPAIQAIKKLPARPTVTELATVAQVIANVCETAGLGTDDMAIRSALGLGTAQYTYDVLKNAGRTSYSDVTVTDVLTYLVTSRNRIPYPTWFETAATNKRVRICMATTRGGVHAMSRKSLAEMRTEGPQSLLHVHHDTPTTANILFAIEHTDKTKRIKRLKDRLSVYTKANPYHEVHLISSDDPDSDPVVKLYRESVVAYEELTDKTLPKAPKLARPAPGAVNVRKQTAFDNRKVNAFRYSDDRSRWDIEECVNADVEEQTYVISTSAWGNRTIWIPTTNHPDKRTWSYANIFDAFNTVRGALGKPKLNVIACVGKTKADEVYKKAGWKPYGDLVCELFTGADTVDLIEGALIGGLTNLSYSTDYTRTIGDLYLIWRNLKHNSAAFDSVPKDRDDLKQVFADAKCFTDICEDVYARSMTTGSQAPTVDNTTLLRAFAVIAYENNSLPGLASVRTLAQKCQVFINQQGAKQCDVFAAQELFLTNFAGVDLLDRHRLTLDLPKQIKHFTRILPTLIH